MYRGARKERNKQERKDPGKASNRYMYRGAREESNKKERRNSGEESNKQERRSTGDRSKKREWKFPESLWELLYPTRCPVCDAVLPFHREYCCSSCMSVLPWTGDTVCMKCGKPIADERQEYCGECRKYAHSFDRGVAAFIYTGSMRRAMYQFKAENRRDYGAFFGEAVASVLQPYLQNWNIQAILPVPMHASKRKKRGYNQTEILAQKISGLTGIPVNKKLVRCVRKTDEQKTLGRRERMQNLKNSFQAAGDCSEWSNVLVVDDVYTTGSTIDEISKVLKRSGVKRVYFAVVCIGGAEKKKSVCTNQNV